MDQVDIALKLRRLRALAKARALNEEVVMNLGKLHGAVLTGLGNEAPAVGVLLGMAESMDAETFLFSPKVGNQRSQMPITAVTDMIIESDHDHSFEILYNHLQRKGVEDGNVHWGCLLHGIWPFFTSDMMRPTSLVAGGALQTRRYLEKIVGVYLFGEGAASQGVAHEVLNWLSAQNRRRNAEQLDRYEGMPLSERARQTGVLRPVPYIGVMEINGESIYTKPLDEHGGRDERGSDGKSKFAIWAETYGARGVDVDGDDLEAVIQATKEAVLCAQQPVPEASLLLLHMEGRRTAHNEHMIMRPPDARRDRKWGQGKIEGTNPKLRVAQEDLEKLWESEPLKRYIEQLSDMGIDSEEELRKVLDEERILMGERWQRALDSPPATFEDAVARRDEDNGLFRPHVWSLPLEAPQNMSGEDKTTTDAFLWVMEEFFTDDEGVTFSGEDVGSGGVLVPTRYLQQKFGPERVFDAPISEEAIAGIAVGASLARWILQQYGIVETIGTQFCEMQFMPFNADAEVLFRSISPSWYQKRMPIGIVDVEPYGVVHGGGSGDGHSRDEAGHYMQMPGIVILAPSNAYDLVGLMRAAYECGRPVVFMIPIWTYGERETARTIPEEKYLIPIGKAEVKREGSDITVIAYGNCVNAALREADFLAEEGISLEVVDLRCLQPLDMETIATSIKKTRRAVVMSEAIPTVAEMIIGRIVSNHELHDALSRTRKPMQKTEESGRPESPESMRARVSSWVAEVTGPLFSRFVSCDLDTFNRGPRIFALTRDWPPIASAKDIEWQDLPFEEYVLIYNDNDGDEQKMRALRSTRLAAIAHDLMEY